MQAGSGGALAPALPSLCHIIDRRARFSRRHSGACESTNPESRDSGSGPSDHPGMTAGGQNKKGPLPRASFVIIKSRLAVPAMAAPGTAMAELDRLQFETGNTG